MGCDIHIYLEKKNENGAWETVKGPNPRIESYKRRVAYLEKKRETARAEQLREDVALLESGETLKKALENLNKNYPPDECEQDAELMEEYEQELATIVNYEAPTSAKGWIYSGRNYDLFAILANVRNGYGFAGIDTGDGFVPISLPKGLPKDVSDFVKKEAARWDGDGHSHSYLSVEELNDYNWQQVTNQRGVVSESEYKTYKEKGYPDSYAGGIGGSSTVQLTNNEMELLLKGAFLRKKDVSYYTQITWKEPYYEAVGTFYTETLPALKEIAQENSKDVRLVFWFDN